MFCPPWTNRVLLSVTTSCPPMRRFGKAMDFTFPTNTTACPFTGSGAGEGVGEGVGDAVGLGDGTWGAGDDGVVVVSLLSLPQPAASRPPESRRARPAPGQDLFMEDLRS